MQMSIETHKHNQIDFMYVSDVTQYLNLGTPNKIIYELIESTGNYKAKIYVNAKDIHYEEEVIIECIVKPSQANFELVYNKNVENDEIFKIYIPEKMSNKKV